jgi:hypothetical protein
MVFVIKLGSMKVVTGTAKEAEETFDKFMADDKKALPTIATLDGVVVDISSLRKPAGEMPNGQ